MDTFRRIVAKFAAHYEALYREHGDSSLALNWRDERELLARYGAMLDVVRPADLPVTLLDFGCGLAHFYDYIRGHSPLTDLIEYSGWDASGIFVGACREKHPDLTFYQLDIFHPNDLCQVPTFGYVVGCGVFTEKLDVPWDDMWDYTRETLRLLWSHTGRGLAWNAMSIHLDWERGDLFHLPLDEAAEFVQRELSRHFLIRQDYGLREFTFYVYREEA